MDLIFAFMLLMQAVIVPSLVLGCQLTLGALGITLIYSILRFATFAHSESMAFAAAISVLCLKATAWLGLGTFVGLLVGLPVVIAATIGLLLAFNWIVFRYYQKNRSVAVIFTVVSVGVMFITNSLVRFLVGPGEQTIINRKERFFKYWSTDSEKWIDLKVGNIKTLFENWFGVEEWKEAFTLNVAQSVTLVITGLAVFALFYFLQRTRTGKAMRAFSDNEDLAQLSGINPQRVIQLTWVVSAILIVFAGVLYGMDKGFKPFTYVLLLLPLFAAAVVGGIGSPQGAIAGGFIIAFAENVITYDYRKILNYLAPEGLEVSHAVQIMGTENKFAVTFTVLVLVLIVRPTGIFRGKVL